MKDTVKLKDLLDFTYLSNLSFALNEGHGVFVGNKCVGKDDSYQMKLYLTDDDTVWQLTNHEKEQLYLQDDNGTVLFTNVQDKEGRKAVENREGKACFHQISIHGGETVKVLTIPLQVTSIKRVIDGGYVFCADYHSEYSRMYQMNADERDKILQEKKGMQDYKILDELPLYGDSMGYTSRKRNSLSLYREHNKGIVRISEETCDVYDVELSDSHEIVYYIGESYACKPINKGGVYTYYRNTGKHREILPVEQQSIGKILPWKGNIMMSASEQKHYGLNENDMFYQLNPKSGAVELPASYEDVAGSSVGSGCRYGGGKGIYLYKNTVYFITTLFSRSSVYALRNDGSITPVYDREGGVGVIALAKDRLYFIGMQDMHLQELYSYDMHGKGCRQLTGFSGELYAEKDARPYIPYNFTQDGMELYGWVLEPRGFDPKKSYPAVLDIHGGPKTVYGEVYRRKMQVQANQGCFIFFMNPRGSDGRGNSFTDVCGKYGTVDYEDLIKSTDEVLKKYPAIDTARIGVTGDSYDGFTTDWIVGHADRFEATANQRSVSNWINFAHTSDIGEVFGADQQGADTWGNVDKLWWHSPLKHANQCTTPTLFIHSGEDFRCPYSKGMQTYDALCEHGVTTHLCTLRGENRELFKNGKPRRRVKRLKEIATWVDTYLKDQIEKKNEQTVFVESTKSARFSAVQFQVREQGIVTQQCGVPI